MSHSISVLTMFVAFSLILTLLMIGVPINAEGEDEALPSGWHEGVISDQLLFFGSCDGAVDSSGREHAVFWDGFSPRIQYGISEGGGFLLTTVNNPKPETFFSDARLVLDKEDRPHIVYSFHDRFMDKHWLMYTTLSGEVWTDSIVAQPQGGYNFDVTVDTEGKVHIVYSDWSGIYYVNNVGGPWEEIGNWTDDHYGQYFSIGLDPENMPSICFLNGTDQDHLTYMWWSGSSWEQSDVAGSNNTQASNDLAVGDDGAVHIVFNTYNQTTDTGGLHHAVYTNGSWTERLVAETPSYNYPNPAEGKIAIGSDGTPHICYRVNDNEIVGDEYYWVSKLFYADFDQGNWTSHFINKDGFSPSIAIGPDDLPTLFYTNGLRNVCYLTMGDVPEPTTPSEPTSFELSGCEGMASLGWEPPRNDGGSNITGYKIYRSMTPGGARDLIASLKSTELSYRDKDLEDGQIFYYSVSALNAVGEGMACPEQRTTISSTPSCPPSRVELSLSKEDFDDGVQYWLHWSVPDDGGSPIKGFKIFGSMSGSEPRLWMVVDPSVTELLALDLTGFAITGDWEWPFYFWVVAFNDVGQSQMQSGPVQVPPDQGSTDYVLIGAILGSAALIAILAIFLVKRRNRRIK